MKTKRWSWALVAALAFVSIALLALAFKKRPSEGKVAVVNGSVITQEDFDREMDRVQQRLLSTGKPLIDSQIPEIKKEVLENLINGELLYQESQGKAIKVDPQADELKRAEARKRIEEIHQKLQKGEDFATLAKAFSEGPSRAKGGELGYFKQGQMVKPFEETAFALRPGEVSDLVETRFGYHLIKVIERKPEATIAFEDVKDRLVHYLKQEKTQKEVSLYVQKLKEKAKVERFLTEGP